MTATRTGRLLAASLAASVALSACSALPAPPPPLPSTFIPEIEASAAAPGIPRGPDGFTVVERVAMRVSVEACEEYRNGSAWVLDDNTVVTNRHVVEGAVSIELTSYDGQRYRATTSELSSDDDLALVHIDGAFPEAATIAADEPVLGDELFIVGYPEGRQLTTEPGTFAGDAPSGGNLDTEGAYAIAASTKQGSSGSPAVNALGDVVGVVFASDEKAATIAVSLESLTHFLDSADARVANEPACER